VKHHTRSLAGKKLVDAVAQAAFAKKAERLTVLNVEQVSSLCDWIVICQGDNQFHTRAIANSIIEELAQKRTKPYVIEGLENGRWVIVDFTDVLVHIFIPELRKYYALEDLWPAAARFQITEKTSHAR
jgi:ribosome-associated protein